MKTEDLFAEAASLPVEERAVLADFILKSLTPTDVEIDQQWRQIVRQRVQQIRSGQVEMVPADEVFRRIRERLAEHQSGIQEGYQDMRGVIG